MSDDPPPRAPAAARNAAPILEALLRLLGPEDRVLEIGSGTGEHVVRFAAAMPGTRWQPSDLAGRLPTLRRRLDAEAPPNVAPALALDVTRDPWPEGPFDACLTINTFHIVSAGAVASVFGGAATRLRPGGRLIVYGPVNVDGAYTSAGNREFDRYLRAADPESGLRDLAELDAFAKAVGLARESVLEMPANNRLAVWRRPDAPA